MNNKIKIIAIFGKSGSGKDTILKFFLEQMPHLKKIINTTTRPQREYEVNGKDYHFISAEVFENMEWLQQAKFNDWYYGTSIESLDKDCVNIGIFSINAINQLIKNELLEVYPVYIVASNKTRLLRQLNRENKPDCNEICRRFFTDEEDFKHINLNNYYMYNNNDDNNKDFSDLINGLFDVIDNIEF